MKVRMVGAVVLVSLAVIFIPMILDGREVTEQFVSSSNIPPRPDREFVSKVIPLVEEAPKPEKAATPPVVNPQQAAKVAMASKEAPTQVEKKPTTAAGSASGEDKQTSETRTGLTAWAVQIGSFSSKKNAYALRDKLRGKGFAAFVETLYEQDNPSFRVRVGPELKRELAEKLQKKVSGVYKGKTFIVKHPS